MRRPRRAKTLGIGATPTDIAAGAGGVWIGNGGRLARAQFAGVTAVALTRLDESTGAVRVTVPLPRPGANRSNAAQNHIAFAGGSVWAIGPDYSLARIDPTRNKVVDVSRDVAAVAVVGARDAVWVLTGDGALARVSVAGNRVTARVQVPATGLSDLAVGDRSVWATDPHQGTLWRIDPGARVVQRTIDVGVGADSVAYGLGAPSGSATACRAR